ncbi:hypothetical protein [Streptomyces sp. NPDC005805]|uniref:SCO7460 family lipoprotein n=1 Tax=Streptomyces sp. NPDC005805 TaxID=3157068 RepID=UPI003410BA43
MRTRWRRGVVVAALALLVSGCGVLSTKEDRAFAAELAERVHPGELRLIGARTLFPETSGSEVTYALRDDPDAFVRLRVDAGRERCEGSGDCAAALREARARGEAAAAEWRLLRDELGRCGYEVHAVRVLRGTVFEPWIATELTEPGLADQLARIGGCLERYARALPAATAAERTGTSVHIASPAAVRELPRGEEDAPTLLRLSSSGRQAALAARTSHAVAYTWRDGALLPDSGRPRIVRTREDRLAFTAAVHDATDAWLARSVPGARAVRTWGGVWSLLPGRLDRQRGYVLFCEGPVAADERCLGKDAVLVTVDPAGRLVAEPQVVRDVREGRGPLNLPPLDPPPGSSEVGPPVGPPPGD